MDILGHIISVKEKKLKYVIKTKMFHVTNYMWVYILCMLVTVVIKLTFKLFYLTKQPSSQRSSTSVCFHPTHC